MKRACSRGVDMSWEFHRRVRYYETDRMGVVHHSNYLRLLEDARMDWIGAHIMSYSRMERELGIIIPAVSASGRFKSFLHFDDPFSVSVRLVKFTGVQMFFTYEVRNSDTGELCYEGESVHCFTAGENYHPISLKRSHPELYQKFLDCVEPLAPE